MTASLILHFASLKRQYVNWNDHTFVRCLSWLHELIYATWGAQLLQCSETSLWNKSTKSAMSAERLRAILEHCRLCNGCYGLIIDGRNKGAAKDSPLFKVQYAVYSNVSMNKITQIIFLNFITLRGLGCQWTFLAASVQFLTHVIYLMSQLQPLASLEPYCIDVVHVISAFPC